MHAFSLVCGSTTVLLHDGTNVWTTEYALGTPAEGATDSTDRLDLLIQGATPTAKMRAIESILARARQRQLNGRGPRVFLVARYNTDTQDWRSEIFDASFDASTLPRDVASGKYPASLIVRRAPYWEGAEVEIALDGPGGAVAPATGGVTVTNVPVTSFVDIYPANPASNVATAIPAPIRLRITNNTGVAKAYSKFAIGVNAYASPISFAAYIEAESTIYGAGTDLVAAGVSSNGYNWRTPVLTPTETMIAQWNISKTIVGISAGRWWRLIARLSTVSSGGSVRPAIYEYNGIVPLWTGQMVTVPATSGGLVDLGPIPLPPGEYDANGAAVRLALLARSAVASQPVFDYFYLMPLDAYRAVQQLGFQVPNAAWVEVDDIEGRAYFEDTDGRVNLHVATEGPLMVFPDVTVQRVHLLVEVSGDMPVALTSSVRAWYRPRRLTL